jgi:hypothetical protein
LVADAIAEGWERSIKALFNAASQLAFTLQGGRAHELTDVQSAISKQDNKPQVSSHYMFGD